MKRLFCVGLLSAASAVGAAVLPIYVNDVPLVLPDAGLPTVNALAFVNQSSISVSPVSIDVALGVGGFGFSSAGSLPFETFNTLYYTNELSGSMVGSPGFRFLNTTNGSRRPARWFVNDGEISTGTYLEVRADNIVSTGPLDTGEGGLIRLTGKTADLSRIRLRAGQSQNFPFGGFIGGGTIIRPGFYVNDVGVTDSYWGVGSNGVFLGNGPATQLGSFNPNMPNPVTPNHQNELFVGRRLSTNRVSLPKFNFFGTNNNFFSTNSDFAAFAYTNNVDGTSALIQVVFVRTNGPDADFSARVTFDTRPANGQIFGPSVPMVELSKWYFDPSLDAYITNNFYLTDSMAVLTNLTLFRNSGLRSAGSRRPNVYEFQTSMPFNWPGSDGNTTFTNGMLDQGYVTNRVNLAYAGYSATVYTNTITSLGSPFSLLGGSIIPTNQPGRVEVSADQLNLESTRIRAESTVMLRTKDLAGNQLARLVDAPLVGVDLTSKQPELVISNLALPSVNRLSGTICAWSGLWRNQRIDPVTQATNEVVLHMLVVDHTLQTSVPVQTFQFMAHATNLVIADRLSMVPLSSLSFFGSASDPVRGRKFLIDAQSLDVRGSLELPLGSSWAQSNVVGLVNFTNRGTIAISGAAKYGTDRATPYSNIINSGTNTAVSQFMRTRLLHQSGALIASASQVQVDAGVARIEGTPIALGTNITPIVVITNISGTNSPFPIFDFVTVGYNTNVAYTSYGASVQSAADLLITAGSLSLSNAFLAAGGIDPTVLRPGRLLLSVTNSLVDGGSGAPSYVKCSGFELRRRPAAGDLMGTEVVSTVGINQLRTHVWAAQDRGATAAGFSNNLALGVLGLDVSADNGRAIFRSASGRQALYVDYIELSNGATNFNRAIAVNNNLTIYFANANVPVSKLDGAVGGRFQWVSDFTGPRSSTNLFYRSTGKTYTFNIALVQSPDLDSDGDGIPNAFDEEPIYVAEDADLAIHLVANKLSPVKTLLRWNALGYSTNVVEYKDGPAAASWRVLTNYVQGRWTGPAEVYDTPSGPNASRVYRLRILPPVNP